METLPEFYPVSKPDMFLGISTFTFPWSISRHNKNGNTDAAVMQLFDYAEVHQIRFIQIGDNLPLHNWSPLQLQKIKTDADEKGISIETGTNRLTKENTERYLSIAKKMGSPFLRMVIDDADYHPSNKEIIKVINEILPLLKENNIILAIENHDRFKAVALKDIIHSTDKDYVGICLDTANSLGAGEGIHTVLDTLGPYVVNLHIKDISIKRVKHKMGFVVEGVAAGDGIINIPLIIQQLEQIGRCKTATLEVWSDTSTSEKETIARENHLVDKSIAYLKNILS